MISHTAISSYKKCPRLYELKFVQKYGPRDAKLDDNMLFGEAFHVAIAAHFNNKNVDVELSGWCNKIINNLPDTEDYVGFNLKLSPIIFEVKAVLNFVLKQLGGKYRPVTKRELFGEDSDDYIIEHELYINNKKSGIIDAILFSYELNDYVIVDWKTRAIISEHTIEYDEQLTHYANILSNMGIKIKYAQLIEVRNRPPNPAKFNKDGTPSRTPQTTSYNVWAESVKRAGFDPDKYPDMKEKLKDDDYFCKISTVEITEEVLAEAKENYDMWYKVIESTGVFPPHFSNYNCGRCVFRDYCLMKKKGDANGASELLNNNFIKYDDEGGEDEL